jgi:hypothetical protein
MTGTIATVATSFSDIAGRWIAVAAHHFYLLHRRYESPSLFGPNTKAEDIVKW